jgi:hypothetical protein
LLFFEDESVVRLTPTVGRTWAPVGQTPIVRVTGQRASVLVMSALNLQGRLFFSLPAGKVNATVFIEFLKALLAEYPKRKLFVIADQASAHTAKRVKQFVDSQKRLELFYLPAYSPPVQPGRGGVESPEIAGIESPSSYHQSRTDRKDARGAKAHGQPACPDPVFL